MSEHRSIVACKAFNNTPRKEGHRNLRRKNERRSCQSGRKAIQKRSRPRLITKVLAQNTQKIVQNLPTETRIQQLPMRTDPLATMASENGAEGLSGRSGGAYEVRGGGHAINLLAR